MGQREGEGSASQGRMPCVLARRMPCVLARRMPCVLARERAVVLARVRAVVLAMCTNKIKNFIECYHRRPAIYSPGISGVKSQSRNCN